MDVTAIYALPVPVWVTCETLGATYPTGYGRVRFEVVMPQDTPPTGTAPIVSGVEIPDPHDGELTQWTCEYGAFIPESLKPATTLQRVVVTNVEAPADARRSWNTADLQLAEVINDWFDRVRTWAEILTGQDLDPSHRVYDAEISGTGLTFIVPPHEGSLGMTLTTPSIRPVRPEEWQRILELVRDGTEPPLEELLSRDARAAHRRGFNRRATIDAATAIEVVLSRLLTAASYQLPERQRARLDERPTLGTFVSIAEASGIEFDVPFERLRHLTKSRNDAVHRGQAASSWDTADLVQIAIDFIGAHGTYKRTGEQEPDGSEWVFPQAEAEAGDDLTEAQGTDSQ